VRAAGYARQEARGESAPATSFPQVARLHGLTEEVVVTVRQMKAARALLGWSQTDLSEKSRVSLPTIGNLERDEGLLGGREDTRRRLLAAFKRAGIVFLNVEELGVTLRKAKRKR
jgi:DNA-binding XRE family transcriptional regulator